jgi:TRAP-type transport system small permease protein
MKSLSRAKRMLDWVLDGLVGVTFFGIAILVIVLVIMRYFFNSSIPGGNEALRFAFIFTTFVGAAVLVGRREHIAIHLLTKRFPRTVRRACDALTHAVIAAVSVYLLVLSFRWIAVSGRNLAEELNFPLRYIQVVLPIGCGLTALYAVINILEALFEAGWTGESEE